MNTTLELEESAHMPVRLGGQPMSISTPADAKRPVPGQDGTFDLGNTKEDRVRRYKALAHAVVHYNLPLDGLTQCPYCGGLLLQTGEDAP